MCSLPLLMPKAFSCKACLSLTPLFAVFCMSAFPFLSRVACLLLAHIATCGRCSLLEQKQACALQTPVGRHLRELQLPHQLCARAMDTSSISGAGPSISGSQQPAQQQLQQLLWRVQASAGRALARAGTSAGLAHRLEDCSAEQQGQPGDRAASLNGSSQSLKPVSLEQMHRCRELQALAKSLASLSFAPSVA